MVWERGSSLAPGSISQLVVATVQHDDMNTRTLQSVQVYISTGTNMYACVPDDEYWAEVADPILVRQVEELTLVLQSVHLDYLRVQQHLQV